MSEVLPWPHGTVSGYTNHRCSCPACAEAWRDYQREWSRASAAAGLADGDSRHGSIYGYNAFKCRCGRCSEAARQYRAAYRARRQ